MRIIVDISDRQVKNEPDRAYEQAVERFAAEWLRQVQTVAAPVVVPPGGVRLP